MTIGTNIICGSFGFTFTCHPPPRIIACDLGEGRKWSASFFRITRTGDKENRGSSRCGFSFGFYRGPHPVSNELAPLRRFAWTVWPELPPPVSLPRRWPQLFRGRRYAPAVTRTL